MTVSLAEIARRSNTSPATVSRVLSNRVRVSPDVRRRVLDAVKETGYVPNASARALAAKRHAKPGLVHRMIALAHGMWSQPGAARQQFYEGVLEAAEDRNLSLTIAPMNEEDLSKGVVPLSLSRVRLDGILLRPIQGVDHSVLGRVAPVVILGAAPTPDCAFSTVEPDNAASLPPIVDHLVGLGHTWIEFVARRMDVALYRERYAAFLGRANTLNVRATLASADHTRLAEYAALFAGQPPERRPTAIFASSDLLAIQLIRHLHERGVHVPRDVSVVGCDGHPDGETFLPTITTAAIPWRDIGYCAVTRLVEEIEQPGPRTRTLLGGPLAVRESSGAVPVAATSPK